VVLVVNLDGDGDVEVAATGDALTTPAMVVARAPSRSPRRAAIRRGAM